MARVVVVGAGLGGLASALFLGRRGHDVVVVERDAQSPPGDPEGDFGDWRRPGVPQARQPHRFLGLAQRVLTKEAPDVVDGLLARGVLRTDLSVAGHGAQPGDVDFSMCSRRLVYEAVFRDAVQEESGVEVRGGIAADGLVLRENGAVSTVVGVHTNAKEMVGADLVVDSTGRRSPLGRWFGVLGLAVPPTTTQECGFHYFSRFYRLRDGTEFPSTDSPIASRLDYVTALAFPGDNRTFSLALAVSAADPCRRRLREPEIFDRVLAAFDITAPWIDVGEAITDVHTMARIENRWQRLVDDTGRPLVGGLVLVGDSSLHTNPTFGRGVSLAFAQAQELACTVEEAVVDPIGYVARFEAWTAEHLGVWFETQVAADAARLDQLAAGLRGEKPPRTNNPNMKIFAGLFALAPRDDIVARALGRLINLLITPMELAEDQEVMTRVSTFLENQPELPDLQSQGPKRAEFVALTS